MTTRKARRGPMTQAAARVALMAVMGMVAASPMQAAMAGADTASAAATAPAPAAATASEAATRPQVVALMAAVGDRITLVRQRPTVGSNIIDKNARHTMRVPGQSLNDAVLRGLDQGIAQEEPTAERVLLRWTPDEALSQQLDEVKGHDRDQLLVDAIIKHLRPIPERQGWDRIEVIVPKYRRYEANGMGTKLQGVGIYVQPLGRGVDMIDESLPPGDGEAGGRRVVNPNTGEVVRATTYVAPFMFFERVTLDARTLAVLNRQAQFDATKYNDPMAVVRDVADVMSPSQLADKLAYLAERSAYQAIRGKGATVDVSVPVPAAAMPASAPGQ